MWFLLQFVTTGYTKTDLLAALTAPVLEFEWNVPPVSLQVNGKAENEGKDWFSYKKQKIFHDIMIVNIYSAPTTLETFMWRLYLW